MESDKLLNADERCFIRKIQKYWLRSTQINYSINVSYLPYSHRHSTDAQQF